MHADTLPGAAQDPGIEVVGGPYEEACMTGLMLDERHELWPDGEWIRYARRLTGIDGLMVYRHRSVGSWVLCKWIYGPREAAVPVVLELEAMPLPPDMPGSGRLSGDALLSRCAPVEEMVERMRRGIRDREARRREALRERGAARTTAARLMRRRGDDYGAHLMESGAVPVSAPGENRELHDEVVDTLRTMRKVGS